MSDDQRSHVADGRHHAARHETGSGPLLTVTFDVDELTPYADRKLQGPVIDAASLRLQSEDSEPAG